MQSTIQEKLECKKKTQAPISVLVLDNDQIAVSSTVSYLQDEGLEVRTTENIQEALQIVTADKIDLMLLDIEVQDLVNLDMLKSMVADLSIPVVVLTEKSDPIEKIVWLELGADDYVVKPFIPRELLARIRAVLRRSQPRVIQEERRQVKNVQRVTINDWIIDFRLRQLQTLAGQKIDVTGTEFDLLAILVRKSGEAVSRDELSLKAMNRTWEPNDRSLDIHVHNLRRKLSLNHCEGEVILAVRNIGYMLAAEVESSEY